MKKWVSLFLCCLMLLTALPGAVAMEALPSVGQTVHGFTAKQLGTIDLVGADTCLFEHDRSGAKLLYIQNGDTDRAFNIVFKTPVLDNTGAPHVFEHATISGSSKYPAQNLFFAMFNQTYNTFVNAMTGQTYTCYPASSLSEDQLLRMMDVYMDGVFNPLLLTEPRLLAREAWRYELTDADAPITLSGTVYSEMKGAYTLDNAAHYNLQRVLYPGSIMGNVAGGDPDFIPELTHEQLVAFHDTYYHPSNALIILYGDLDYARFLKALDENYLSGFERREIEVETGVIEVPDGLESADFTFPVERDTPKDDGTVVQYAFALNDATKQDLYGLSVLTDILVHESSPLTGAIREALPGVNLSAYVDMTAEMPYAAFQLNGANPEDAPKLQAIVDEQMAAFVENRFDPEVVKAVIAQYRFSTLMTSEMSNLGVNLAASIGAYWSSMDNLNYFNDFVDALAAMEEKAGEGYFEGLVALLNGVERRALVTTAPAPGAAEEKAAALAEKLAEYKASLTDEEIAQMVEDTRALAEWSAEEAPKEMVEKIQAVSVDSLPEERPTHELTDEVVNGVRRLTAQAEVDQIGMTTMLLSSDFAQADDVPYLMLYGQLLGSMATDAHTREQVSQLIGQRLNGFTVSPGTQKIAGKDVPLYRFYAQWISLMDHYDEDVKLVDEVLFHTDFSDTAELSRFVKRSRASMKQMISQNAMNIQIMRAAAKDDPEVAYQLMISGLDYYKFLGEVEALLETEPQAVVQKLESIKGELYNRSGALCLFAGNEEGQKISAPVLDAYFAGMPDIERAPADYSGIELPMKREAIVVDSQVQFNLMFASLEALGVTRDGRFEPLGSLISDAYMIPVLRHQMGVYTPQTMLGEEFFLLITFRDPNVGETFTVYEGIGDFLRGLSLDQKEVDPYILKSYSYYAMPMGKLNGALKAINDHLEGKTNEDILEYMRQIKSLKAEDIATFAELFDKLNEVGMRSTAGAQSAIEQNAGLYDQILSPLAEAGEGEGELEEAA